MKKITFITAVIVHLAGTAFSQTQANTFFKTYGTGQRGILNSVVEVNDNGFIATGKTGKILYPAGTSIDSLLIIKTDDKGSLQWSKSIANYDLSVGISVIRTTDNNYAVLGYGQEKSTNFLKVLLIKIDIGGNVLWTSTYETGENFYPSSICNSGDGGFFMNAVTSGASWKTCVVKLDSLGNILFSKKIANLNSNYTTKIIRTNDNGFLMNVDTGVYYNPKGARSWINKIDDSGNLIWSRVFFNTGNIKTLDIFETSDNSILVGMTSSVDNGSGGYTGKTFSLLKLNPLGDTVWVKKYFSVGNERAYITESSGGSYIIATPTIHGNAPSVIIKTDTSGNINWNKYFSHSNNVYTWDFYLTSVYKTQNEAIIFSGESYIATTPNSNNGFIVKLDSTGFLLCKNDTSTMTVVRTAEIKYSDSLIMFDPVNVITGNSVSVIAKSIVTYLFCETVGIKEEGNLNAKFKIYPNPAATEITLDFSGLEQNIILWLYNAQGQLVRSTKINMQSEHSLNISNLANGLYFIKISDGKTTNTQRFIKQ